MPYVAKSVEEIQGSNWENVEVGEGTIWANPFDVVNSLPSDDGGIRSYEDYFWLTDLPEKLHTLINKNLIYPNYREDGSSHASFLLTKAEQLLRIKLLNQGVGTINLHVLKKNQERGCIMEVYYMEDENIIARRGLVMPKFDGDGKLELITLDYVTGDTQLHNQVFKPEEIVALIRSFN